MGVGRYGIFVCVAGVNMPYLVGRKSSSPFEKRVFNCSARKDYFMRGNSNYRLMLLMLATAFAAPVAAQDLHFSQWFNSPLTTNPANTGFIPDADYREGANYRSQWVNVLSAPYKMMSIWGDAQVFRDRIENG